MPTPIIQQTLHGYSSGHRLLAASLELTPDARDLLVAFSDLSGTRPQKGFESYLTGYPLLESGYYVFARTWLAPEMSRPGSVWTHSLLIPLDLFGELDDAAVLMSLHHRPQAGEVAN